MWSQQWADTLRDIRHDMVTLAAAQQQTALTLEKVSTSYQVGHVALETEVRERTRGLAKDIADVANDLTEFRRRVEGGPQRFVGWVAVGIATMSLLLTGTIAALGGIVWLIMTLTAK